MGKIEKLQKIRWIGFDFGGTLANPVDMSVETIMESVFGEGEPDCPGIIQERIRRFYALITKYASFPRLLELGVWDIYADVLDNDSEKIRKYEEAHLNQLRPAADIKETISFLKEKNISINLVSDASSGKMLETIIGFLQRYHLWDYFDNVFTGLGRVDSAGNHDASFRGSMKRNGSMYVKLLPWLEEAGFKPYEAVMIGDDSLADVQRAQEAGLYSIIYTGFSGTSEHEAGKARPLFRITNFRDLCVLFK